MQELHFFYLSAHSHFLISSTASILRNKELLEIKWLFL